MAIIAISALILSICGLLFSVYVYLEMLKKPSGADIPKALESYSNELKTTYGRYIKEIETEWIDMYEKFKRLAGRMDKEKGLLAATTPPTPEVAARRSDLLRKHRGGANE